MLQGMLECCWKVSVKVIGVFLKFGRRCRCRETEVRGRVTEGREGFGIKKNMIEGFFRMGLFSEKDWNSKVFLKNWKGIGDCWEERGTLNGNNLIYNGFKFSDC